MWHPFNTDISAVALPRQFTYPFHYTPHPLCVAAARQVQDYLSQQTQWHDELQEGKMFGVLVVQDERGAVGFLAAFSGILAGGNTHPYFVPPVYDFLQPDSFFRQEEACITALNRRIEALQQDAAYRRAEEQRQQTAQGIEREREALKQWMRTEKQRRDALRQAHPEDAGLQAKLIKESQFQKAELKRKEQVWKNTLRQAEIAVEPHRYLIEELKQERKTRSAALQDELFSRFRVRNARGEETDLLTLFAHTAQRMPPAGAGECAAPKLLQYAYTHSLRPLAMAEFWWGRSPRTELRRHRAYYPACQGKCAPILAFMLQGLDVEPNPLQSREEESEEPRILYEDSYLMVIDKPAGLRSVPGKDESPSVYTWVRRHRPEAEGPLMVHRLDQATSGLMLIAKSKAVHEALQKQFEGRTVRKRYIALVEGLPAPVQGCIRLPLCPDPQDRPRQQVHPQGKPAETHYEVRQTQGDHARVALYPHTGRTHQLRVHAAHPDGLHAPIQGDKLYGARHTEGRLCLHADRLEFRHPVSGEKIVVEIATPF